MAQVFRARVTALVLACSALAALALAPAGTVQEPASALPAAGLPDTIFGLTDTGTLTRFSSASPSVLNLTVPITGLPSGVTLAAIDFRPATGQLYGLGLHTASMSGRLYVINPNTGAASVVGSAPFYSPLDPNLDYDIDFNPGADRVRMINSHGLNLRVNPATGMLSAHDTDLHSVVTATQQYASVAYAPAKPGLSASTAYVYEYLSDTLFMIGGPDGLPSANGGLLTKIGPAGVASGVPEAIGMDIANSGLAYVSLQHNGHYGLYALNLGTGAVTLVGSISNGLTAILDISVVPRFNIYLPTTRK